MIIQVSSLKINDISTSETIAMHMNFDRLWWRLVASSLRVLHVWLVVTLLLATSPVGQPKNQTPRLHHQLQLIPTKRFGPDGCPHA